MANTHPVAARVAALIAAGVSPIDALKAVCGVENVTTMIDNLYHELRAKGGR